MYRPILLTGFMACGKSTVGRAVAEAAAIPFLDLDDALEQRAGMPIPQIFEQQGEVQFRRLERQVLSEALEAEGPRVIATGGGALLDRQMRLHALQSAVVISLRASPQTVLERAARDDGRRPLLQHADRRYLEGLMSLRETSYAESHVQLDTDAAPVEKLVDEVLKTWRRDPIAVAAGLDSYRVELTDGQGPARAVEGLESTSSVLLISDANVDPLFGASYRSSLSEAGHSVSTFLLAPGEEHKNPDTLRKLWEFALERELDRRSWVIGLGGGVVTDVAGFLAATWMRGVRWMSFPTTMLGMVDASVGGKTAVDLGPAKNCVGAFWQPKRVVCDVNHLTTEPERGYISGLAEAVKTGLLGDANLLDLLENESAAVLRRDPEVLESVVRRAIRVKARVVSLDQRESGVRACLNLGHTVGHAIEACGGFGRYTHGEAVSLGLVAALRIGERLGHTPAPLARRAEQLLSRLGLPTDLSREPLNEVAKLLIHDKKRRGSHVRFVFTPNPGEYCFQDLRVNEVERLVRELS